MSKEVMIGMLKVAKNGNEMLQILDALTDTNEEVISSDALQSASDFIQPNNTNDQTIGEMIDSFLD